MFDSLHPALEVLDSCIVRQASISEAFTAAAQAAARGRDATIPMVARKGRASYLGERSAGHQDPGATSVALLFEAAAATFAN
jgi:dihydroxyacetone kinase-like protein